MGIGLLALYVSVLLSNGANAPLSEELDCFAEFSVFNDCCCENKPDCYISEDELKHRCCDHLISECPAVRAAADAAADRQAWANNTYFQEVMEQLSSSPGGEELQHTPTVFVPSMGGFAETETAALCHALWRFFQLAPSGEVPLARMLQRKWIPGSRDGDDSSRFYPGQKELYQDLYQSTQSPYEGLVVTSSRAQSFDVYPSNAYRNARAIKETVLSEFNGEYPRLIVEVGSLIGSGALVWGSLMQESPKRGIVICVDTWQGDLTMRLDIAYRNLANITHGFPTFGMVFMERMLGAGMQETVYPLPMPGSLAARFLYVLGYKVDVVYIDSAHERGETALELHLYYQLLRPGGLLMGDDGHSFPAVAHDLQLFAKCHNLSLSIFAGEQWLIRKPW